MRDNIAGYLIRNPLIRYKLRFEDDVFGPWTKAEFESEILRQMQVTASLYDCKVKIAPAFLKQIEPKALASVELHKGKYLLPKEISFKVLTEEEYNEALQAQKEKEEEGHYSQLM